MFQCLPGLYIAVFDKVSWKKKKKKKKAKCHPLTRFALMALARKNEVCNRARLLLLSLSLSSTRSSYSNVCEGADLCPSEQNHIGWNVTGWEEWKK